MRQLARAALHDWWGSRKSDPPQSPLDGKHEGAEARILLWAAWPDFPTNLLLLEGFTLLCGGAFFKPDAPDRGSFYVVIFLRVAEIAGFNMLVAFSRAET